MLLRVITPPQIATASSRSFRTRAVHAGQHPEPVTGALATPVFQTSSFAYGSFERGSRIFAGQEQGYLYSRFANPTVGALEDKLADLEGAEAAVAVASGMAAVSAVTFGLLSPGDEVLVVGPLYGGTQALLSHFLTRFGITVSSGGAAPRLQDALRPSTRMVWVETPTNPLLGVHDLAGIAALARAHGAVSVADNTFATPYLTRPLEYGLDLVVHSTTKYIGGHGDAIGGAVVGASSLLGPVRDTALKFLGGSLGPAEAALLLRSLKTLPARMEAHCDGAQVVAEALRDSGQAAKVNYPGLPEHPGHSIAARQMRRFGGIISFELAGGRAAAAAFLDALRLFTQAVSVGDVDSLACHPASTLHSSIGAAARARDGITEGLVRLSVGIEDPDDLVADIQQALRAALAVHNQPAAHGAECPSERPEVDA
jgi:methionine-gamma-lyase